MRVLLNHYGKLGRVSSQYQTLLMAQIQPQPMEGKSKRKVHAALPIDMTPMVDLGFLLITFFIFTTTMAEKRATSLIMPKEGEPSRLSERKALTAILGKDNKVYVYAGKFENAMKDNKIISTNYTTYQGLGSLIRAKQKQLNQDKSGLMLLIKPLNMASYQNLVDALDEALINDVQRYAIVEASAEEKAYVASIQPSTGF